VPRFDLGIYREVTLRDRAMPDVMIAITAANKITAVLSQDPFDLAREIVH
jgi:hypothetical protein